MQKKYICYVATHYPSFEIHAESEDDAWQEAATMVWDKENAETEITCEVIPEDDSDAGRK